MGLFDPKAPGPSAALEAKLTKQLYSTFDPIEKAAILEQLHEVWSRAWKEPVPEEDAEWARLRLEKAQRSLDPHWRDFAGRWAYDAYLQSSGGLLGGEPAPPEPLDKEPWRDFGNRVRKAPPEESEEETLAAALAAYVERAGQPVPPPSEHWQAAARAVREKFKQIRR